MVGWKEKPERDRSEPENHLQTWREIRRSQRTKGEKDRNKSKY